MYVCMSCSYRCIVLISQRFMTLHRFYYCTCLMCCKQSLHDNALTSSGFCWRACFYSQQSDKVKTLLIKMCWQYLNINMLYLSFSENTVSKQFFKLLDHYLEALLKLLVTLSLNHPSIMHYEHIFNAPIVLYNHSHKQVRINPNHNHNHI